MNLFSSGVAVSNRSVDASHQPLTALIAGIGDFLKRCHTVRIDGDTVLSAGHVEYDGDLIDHFHHGRKFCNVDIAMIFTPNVALHTVLHHAIQPHHHTIPSTTHVRCSGVYMITASLS